MQKGAVFGSVLDLDTLEIDLSLDIMIPGVAVASSRATPLAGEYRFLTLLTNVSFLASISMSGILGSVVTMSDTGWHSKCWQRVRIQFFRNVEIVWLYIGILDNL